MDKKETMLASDLQMRKGEDSQTRLITKNIKNVITICGNEQTKPSDTERDKITSSVSEQQVEVAIEMRRSHWGKKDISGESEETTKILKVAYLLESTALEKWLDDAFRNRSLTQNVSRRLKKMIRL